MLLFNAFNPFEFIRLTIYMAVNELNVTQNANHVWGKLRNVYDFSGISEKENFFLNTSSNSLFDSLLPGGVMH